MVVAKALTFNAEYTLEIRHADAFNNGASACGYLA